MVTCRRCNHKYEGYPAISRTDNKSKICSDCGVDEAMEDFLRGSPTPKSEWPVNH